jgi:poly(A) polymerase Pap1
MDISNVIVPYLDTATTTAVKKAIILFVTEELEAIIERFASESGVAVTGYRILQYGSCALETNLRNSDLDLLAILPNIIQKSRFLTEFMVQLSEQGGEKCKMKDGFIIQFKVQGINVDLTAAVCNENAIPEDLMSTYIEQKDFARMAPVKFARSLRTRIQNYETFRLLTIFIKIFLKSK